MLGSLGFTEIAFILVLALLLFGPKRLPEIGRTLGKGLAEFRRASNELKRSLESEVALDESSTRRPAGVGAASSPKPSIATLTSTVAPGVPATASEAPEAASAAESTTAPAESAEDARPSPAAGDAAEDAEQATR